MESKTQINELAMALVEEALSRPEDQREEFLHQACGSNLDLFTEAWSYVRWEKRMQRFLLDPVIARLERKAPFEPGQILIHRFRIIREVAQGGMGIVWEAIDQKLDDRVALKCAKTGFGMHLPPEVRNAREITHPNICKIFEIHTASTLDGEIDFISMEFLDGETLADRLRREPLSGSEALAIARQLCAGLAEAHRNHLLHGDLKPNNIILTRDADSGIRAVITDFGLARAEDSSAGVLGGAPAYMAPELWKGGKPSVASDIYALGVILWELHSGQLPSGLGIVSSTLDIGERVSWKRPTGHGKWERIIACCLHPDPAQRFHSVTEITRAFGPTQLRKWLTSVAAMVLLTVITGWITYAVMTRPPKSVRLALLPLVSGAGADASVSGAMLRNTAKELGQLHGDKKTAFDFIPLDNVIRNRVNTPDEARVLMGASHSLRFLLERSGEGFKVHGYLTDLSSGVDVREWAEEYKTDEIRYAPTALAGLVTGALHLPPPTGGAGVNAAARKNYETGLIALRQDRTVGQALQSFELASEVDHDSALIYAGLAEAQRFIWATSHNKKWFNKANESVKQAQIRNFDLASVQCIAGLLKADAGAYDQAIGDYLRSIELDSKNADAFRRLGQVYEKSGRFEDALISFRKAVEIDPKQSRNWRLLGNFFLLRGRYRDAIIQYRKALQFSPDDPYIRYRLGTAYKNLGDFVKAEKELRASLAISKTPDTSQGLGMVLLYQKRERDAIPPLLQALNLGPQTSLRWWSLGTAYRRLHLIPEAQHAFRRGLEVAESELTQNPQDALRRTHLAILCAQLNYVQRAESEIGQALKQKPNDAEVIFMAAITYEVLGERNVTLSVLAAAPPDVLADLDRWPDVAELSANPGFRKLLASRER